MKKLFFSYFLILFVLNHSNAQNNTAYEFYSYLNQILENKSNKSVELLVTNYGCLGSKIYTEAQLRKKENKIEIQYYSQNPKDIKHLDILIKRLDTTFKISQIKLISNFKNEITAIESRMILLEPNLELLLILRILKKYSNLKKLKV